MVSKFCEVIPSTLDALDAVHDKVMTVVQSLPCVPEEFEDVAVALREALANAVLHGNQNDPAKRVVVACFCECEANGGLLLVVRDEGAGFNPSEVPDPTQAECIDSEHGRGIFLMRQFMDDVRYRKGGREVEIRKRRK
ncbi:MAG: ATP-binding protein [Acidobacteria bacterium]|nr:ATP-binding protein [Acidobacteriota bacterium]